MLKYTYKYF